MTKVRKKIGTIPINDIEQQVQQSTQAAVAQMQQDVSDFIDEETAQYPEIGGAFKFQEDPEGRSEITTDAEGKIISYRNADGTKVENIGIEVSNLSAEKSDFKECNIEDLDIKGKLSLSEEAEDTIKSIEGIGQKNYTAPKLPKYGHINIKTESFYLTADNRVSSIDDVVCIQDYEDTQANADDRMTICHYYIKSTLTNNGDGTYSINANSVRLQHYASGKVKLNTTDNKYYAKDPVRKVNGNCYYADSLGYIGNDRIKVIEGYTRNAEPDASLAEGAVKQTEVEVVPITGPVEINSWTKEDWDFNGVMLGADIGKKYEHNCIVDIDFGDYYSKNNAPIGIKHQGNSTMKERKKNLRFTFYKKNDYAKKDKIKIGEMIRLSGFNVKSNSVDAIRVAELITYRVMLDIWNSRPITDRYNWDNKINGYYHGATGFIQGFPVRVDINDVFYGLDTFTLKKDEKNYMLDGEDESGFFIIGCQNEGDVWGRNLPYSVPQNYEDEMLDSLSESTVEAMQNWTHFINNRLYKGSDNNIYNSTELTEVEGTMYVTSTLDDGAVTQDSVSATLIPFDKKNIPDRLDVQGFIDYIICLQVFLLRDNGHNNLIFYSDEDKKKVWPFFYDVDQSLRFNAITYNWNIFDEGVLLTDMSFWEDLIGIYEDSIINRYDELRKGILSKEYLKELSENIISNIPANDFLLESEKWGINVNADTIREVLAYLYQRLDYIDTNLIK